MLGGGGGEESKKEENNKRIEKSTYLHATLTHTQLAPLASPLTPLAHTKLAPPLAKAQQACATLAQAMPANLHTTSTSYSHSYLAPMLKAGPSMYCYEGIVADLAEAGFSGYCLANNHIADYGESGITHSINAIKKANAAYLGATSLAYPKLTPLFYTLNHTRIAILNAAESQFGMLDAMSAFLGADYGYVDCFSHDFVRQIRDVKKSVDVLICVIHAGLENTFLPLPQFRELYAFFCDMGADCIIAHHPHVIQGYEDYRCSDGRESRIFYSLGNFCFAYGAHMLDAYEKQGLSVIIHVDRGVITDYELVFSQLHHAQDGNYVVLMDSSALLQSMSELNAPLHDATRYRALIIEMIKRHYPSYMRYYESVFLIPSPSQSLLEKTKTWIKHFFFPDRHLPKRQALLFHNIAIPTHRFIQELYLKYVLYYS